MPWDSALAFGGAEEGVEVEEEAAIASGRGEAGALLEVAVEAVEGFAAIAEEDAFDEEDWAAEAAVIGAVEGVRGTPLTFVERWTMSFPCTTSWSFDRLRSRVRVSAGMIPSDCAGRSAATTPIRERRTLAS